MDKGLPSLIDTIRADPLYQKAFEAFQRGDKEEGMKLLHSMQNGETMKVVNQHIEKNKDKKKEIEKQAGIQVVEHNEPMPDGYNRNSFSNNTCITTQQKDLPEWEGIVAEILYEGKPVFEAHYMMRFTTENSMFGIKQDNPKLFVGNIVSSSDASHTLGKFQKNALYMIVDKLSVKLTDVEYSIQEIVEPMQGLKYLKEVMIKHPDRTYTDQELKELKKIFKKSYWL